MRTRAYRRHQVKRCLNKRKNGFCSGASKKALKRHVITPISCCYWMCDNPKRYLNELTPQEHRAILNFQESLFVQDKT